MDFFATWCGPCVAISPFVEELSERYPDVVFLKIDVDELSVWHPNAHIFCAYHFVLEPLLLGGLCAQR